jgi:hypothetical protein
MFKTKFAKYVCEGDSINCSVSGFDCKATVYRDDSAQQPDKMQDGFWPSLDPKDAGYIGPKSKSTLARQMKRAHQVMEAWKSDEWFYCGIAVTVSRNDVELTHQYGHALWGIDCNYPGSDNSYLRDVANELLPEALDEAESILDKLLSDWKAA